MLRAAETRYAKAARLAAAAARLAAHAWDRVLLDALDAWQPARLASQVSALQLLAAQDADPYVTDVLLEQLLIAEAVADLDPWSFVGVAGDGRPLLSLLDEPRIAAKTAIGQGLGAQQAWDQARNSLQRMSATAVQDAGRGAESVAMVARPAVTGYVRVLNLPSCARCVILAGRFYEWNRGFARHPLCDCLHVPSTVAAAEGQTVDPAAAFRAGKVKGLGRADTQAIEDGANIGQVVNAHRGMATAQVYGRTLKITREGITKRGLAGQRLGEFELRRGNRYRTSRTPRLMPESIYKLAGDDRDEALRLLKLHGYLI
jgi:hypothetical protein